MLAKRIDGAQFVIFKFRITQNSAQPLSGRLPTTLLSLQGLQGGANLHNGLVGKTAAVSACAFLQFDLQSIVNSPKKQIAPTQPPL